MEAGKKLDRKDIFYCSSEAARSALLFAYNQMALSPLARLTHLFQFKSVRGILYFSIKLPIPSEAMSSGLRRPLDPPSRMLADQNVSASVYAFNASEARSTTCEFALVDAL